MKKMVKQMLRKGAAAGLVISMAGLSACGGRQNSESAGRGAADGGQQTGVQGDTPAQTQDGGSKGKKTITLWLDFSTPERESYLNETINAYMQEHPDIKVQVTALPNKVTDKVLVAYEAGQGPDIYFSSGPDVVTYINGNYIIPLDSYYDSWEGKDGILPASIEDVRKMDVTGEDKLWYMPLGTAFYCLWVRSDWLEETGSSVDTWEHLFEAVPKMTDTAAKRYGIAIRGGSGGSKFLERMMYSYSGIMSVFDENGKCTINDPKNVEFVERYLGMYGKYTAEGDLNYDWTELSAAFDSGSAGIIIHNLGSAEDHVKAFGGDLTKFKAVPLPMSDSGVSVTQLQQEAGLCIASTCKYPQEAFDLAAYLVTGDSISRYCELYGLVPVDKNVLETASWIKEKPWYALAAENMQDPNVKFYNYYPWLSGKEEVYKNMITEMQYVMTGQMSAQDFLDMWAEDFQKCYDNFYNR